MQNCHDAAVCGIGTCEIFGDTRRKGHRNEQTEAVSARVSRTNFHVEHGRDWGLASVLIDVLDLAGSNHPPRQP